MKSNTLKRLGRLAAILLIGLTAWLAVADQRAGRFEELRSQDVEVRRAAAAALAEGQGVSTPAELMRAARLAVADRDTQVRLHGLQAMVGAASADEASAHQLAGVAGPLIAHLRDDSAQVREAAARALALTMPRPPARATSPLVSLLSDPETRVRRAALAALARTGGDSPEAVAAVFRIVREVEDPSVKADAIRTLGDWAGIADAETVDALTAALAEPNVEIRRQAARVLGKIGPAARAAEAALQRMAADPEEDPTARDSARAALGKVRAQG